ncbi:fluoride efflux transporter FluC [Umezawaea endophytica]|uniref:Fluoride-specific ion channel FluC n=1 Tax=Umezawaea endophytica TaxID=1654476 RepID=A0A9X3AE50_9PSEU|nr:CrcB family protein [Umezawaea endophytica]MCS7476431.1 CrcB family protein [Umezawaea endophytica]
MTALLVALGAAVGAPLRYLAGRAFPGPRGTLLVNVVGSLLLGFLVGLPADGAVLAGLGTGFCGALTTYSTFSLDTLELVEKGARGKALLNVGVSLALGLTAAQAGLLLAALAG